MVEVLDNITIQARQGSVAAIIQVLNEKLAESGVRARAVVAQGVLQLLCEADSPKKLDQSSLIDQVRNVLESIRPRYIRRVKVNTRLVSEHQLLWLDEIEDDPDSQLLWTAEFSLSRRSLAQHLKDLAQRQQSQASGTVLADTSERERQKRRVWQTLVGIGGLGIFLCLSGWAIYGSLSKRSIAQRQDTIQANQVSLANDESNASAASPLTSPETTSPEEVSEINGAETGQADNVTPDAPDPFAQAVRLAEQSVEDGKSAATVDEWMDLAARWQRASDLMGDVTTEDERYAIAQDRTALYKQNSLDSLKQAELAKQALGEE